ncbi:MAG: tetratricopeptide repeat protein [Reyranellaceae bacterium]
MRSSLAVAVVLLSGIAFAADAGAQGGAQGHAANLALCGDPQPDKAIKGCTAIIELGGIKGMSLYDAHFNRGLAWSQKNQHVKAIADYDVAVKLRPKEAALLQSRCWSRAVLGRLTQALQDCNAALAIDPRDPDTLEIRGFTYRKMRDFQRSLADYEAALELRPDAASTLFGRGVTKQDMGVYDEGKADIRAARQMDAAADARYIEAGVHR